MELSVQESIYHLFYGLTSNTEKGATLFQNHSEAIKQARPEDIILAVDRLMQEDLTIEQVKKGIAKTLNLMHRRLNELPSPDLQENGFFDSLVKNNNKLDQLLKGLRPVIKKTQPGQQAFHTQTWNEILFGIRQLQTYSETYTLSENILFPVFEKQDQNFHCVHVMWSIHDDIRKNLKELEDVIQTAIAKQDSPEDNRLNELLGDLFFDLYAIRFRLEKILIPAIVSQHGEEEYNRAWAEAEDLEFPLIIQSNRTSLENNMAHPVSGSGVIQLPTGKIDTNLLELTFKHLPIDLTFVDKNDEVVFYSDPPHRIFPRTPAVIGRKVQNCHPKESVAIVNRIVEAFKSGEKDEAAFWINFKNKKIQITYYAVRDETGYQGVLEVSQDITSILKHVGERRLLDW